MSKDDWPSTETAELIDRAYRRGWLPIREGLPSYWRVEFVKRGHGQVAKFYPRDDGSEAMAPSPACRTRLEVYA